MTMYASNTMGHAGMAGLNERELRWRHRILTIVLAVTIIGIGVTKLTAHDSAEVAEPAARQMSTDDQ